MKEWQQQQQHQPSHFTSQVSQSVSMKDHNSSLCDSSQNQLFSFDCQEKSVKQGNNLQQQIFQSSNYSNESNPSSQNNICKQRGKSAVKEIAKQLLKVQQNVSQNIFHNKIPENFPFINVSSKKQYDIYQIFPTFASQYQFISEMYIQFIKTQQSSKANHTNIIDAKTEKITNELNFYKTTCQKQDQIIKNLKLEQEYYQKQQQQQKGIICQLNDSDKLQTPNKQQIESTQVSSLLRANKELNLKLQRAEDTVQNLAEQMSKQKQEKVSFASSKMKELEELIYENNNLKEQIKQLQQSVTSSPQIQENHPMLKKLEELLNAKDVSPIIQLNVHSNQFDQINKEVRKEQTKTNCIDLMRQQVFMSKELESLLSPSSSSYQGSCSLAKGTMREHQQESLSINQSNMKKLEEQVKKELEELQIKGNDLDKEGQSLTLEVKEVQGMHESLKNQFAQLLDKFQKYIQDNENMLQQKESQYQQALDTLQTQNAQFIKDLQYKETEIQILSQRIQEEELSHNCLLDQKSSTQQQHQQQQLFNTFSEDQSISNCTISQNKCLQKELSFTQQLPSQDQSQQVLIGSIKCGEDLGVDIFKVSSSIIDKISKEDIKKIKENKSVCEKILKRITLNSGTKLIQLIEQEQVQQEVKDKEQEEGEDEDDQLFDEEQNTKLMRILVDQQEVVLSKIQQHIENICKNIEQTYYLSEFKEISENILQQFEDSNQEPQYFYDLLGLLQNLMKISLNKEIECGIFKKNCENLIETLNQQSMLGGKIDIGLLIKRQIDEMLQIKIENQQLISNVNELQKQMFEKQEAFCSIMNTQQNASQTQINEVSCEEVDVQSKQENNKVIDVQNVDDEEKIQYSFGKSNQQKFSSFSSNCQSLKEFEIKTEQNQTAIFNYQEVKQLYEELDRQLADTKDKVDQSNQIIKNLELSLFKKQQLLDQLKTLIVEVAQLFEQKKIDEVTYPLPALLEFSRDKVKRTLGKLESFSDCYDKFQAMVLKEIEALNYTLTYKKPFEEQQNYCAGLIKGPNQPNNWIYENLYKFMQLFRLLKERVLKQVEMNQLEKQQQLERPQQQYNTYQQVQQQKQPLQTTISNTHNNITESGSAMKLHFHSRNQSQSENMNPRINGGGGALSESRIDYSPECKQSSTKKSQQSIQYYLTASPLNQKSQQKQQKQYNNIPTPSLHHKQISNGTQNILSTSHNSSLNMSSFLLSPQKVLQQQQKQYLNSNSKMQQTHALTKESVYEDQQSKNETTKDNSVNLSSTPTQLSESFYKDEQKQQQISAYQLLNNSQRQYPHTQQQQQQLSNGDSKQKKNNFNELENLSTSMIQPYMLTEHSINNEQNSIDYLNQTTYVFRDASSFTLNAVQQSISQQDPSSNKNNGEYSNNNNIIYTLSDNYSGRTASFIGNSNLPPTVPTMNNNQVNNNTNNQSKFRMKKQEQSSSAYKRQTNPTQIDNPQIINTSQTSNGPFISKRQDITQVNEEKKNNYFNESDLLQKELIPLVEQRMNAPQKSSQDFQSAPSQRNGSKEDRMKLLIELNKQYNAFHQQQKYQSQQQQYHHQHSRSLHQYLPQDQKSNRDNQNNKFSEYSSLTFDYVKNSQRSKGKMSSSLNSSQERPLQHIKISLNSSGKMKQNNNNVNNNQESSIKGNNRSDDIANMSLTQINKKIRSRSLLNKSQMMMGSNRSTSNESSSRGVAGGIRRRKNNKVQHY